MHTTMQTLGRVAIIGGGVLVVGDQRVALRRRRGDARGAEGRDLRPGLRARARHPDGLDVRGAARRRHPPTRRAAARCAWLRRANRRAAMLDPHPERPPVNWWILGGGLAFAVVSLTVGFGQRAGRAGDRLRGVDGDRAVPDVEARARARARGAQHAGRHGARHLRVPRDARPGRGLDLVDDRRAEVRPAVPRAARR